MSRAVWIAIGLAAWFAWRSSAKAGTASKGASSGKGRKAATTVVQDRDWTIRTFTSRYSEAQGQTILDTITTQERQWKTWARVPGNDRARPSLMLRAEQIPIAGQETVDAWTTRTGVALWLEGM